jgi:hypothetical protein
MAEDKKTTDHERIRRWAEERGGRPALVAGHHDGPLSLRIEFPEDQEGQQGLEWEPKEILHLISWDEFFTKFDEANLEFLYRDETEPWVC